jgi:diguanylate cyclase (GGDEF)-like protein
MASNRKADAVARAVGAEDLLVFELTETGARLRGGVGRGAGWAGVVEVALDEQHLRGVADGQRVKLIRGAEPVHVVGPYWSPYAALVRAGDHVVVFGGPEPIRSSSAELMRRATEAVAAVGAIPPSKLLADELELVEAVRQLGDHVPQSLAGMATHVAGVAADALSCEIGAVLLQHEGRTSVHGAGPAWDAVAQDEVLAAALHDLAARAARGPILEQDLASVGKNGLRIVSCYALGIGRAEPFGALIVGHTDARPRGFTLLCQRVGRALADASEPALRHAMALDELAAQRDHYAREARTDTLTGLGNRVAWDDTLAIEQARWERHHRPIVLGSIDLDHLKQTNDRFGHAAGDELLAAAAAILRRSLRGGDVIARIGGDEFAVVLAEAGPTTVETVGRRLVAECAAWRGSHPEVRLAMSVGWAAPSVGESLQETFCRADAAMYDDKRRAGEEGSGPPPKLQSSPSGTLRKVKNTARS